MDQLIGFSTLFLLERKQDFAVDWDIILSVDVNSSSIFPPKIGQQEKTNEVDDGGQGGGSTIYQLQWFNG
jgi:hypothetical protein